MHIIGLIRGSTNLYALAIWGHHFSQVLLILLLMKVMLCNCLRRISRCVILKEAPQDISTDMLSRHIG